MSSGAGATSPNNCKVRQESYLDTLDTFEPETDANGAITVHVNSEDKCCKEEADAGVTFFMDEEGRYYYQQSGENQDIHPVNCEEYQDNTEATLQAQQGQVLGGEGYQTVTLAPSEGGAESCYVLVVQEETKPEMYINIKTDQDEDQVSNVHEFDKEEEESALEELSDGNESFFKKNFSKSASVVKPTISVERERFRCSDCPYMSHRRYLLMRHLKSHSSQRPHKCNVCERGFKTVATLRNHENFHNGIKLFVCKYCKKPFTTSGELVRHVKYRHTHEKPHKCEECGYASVELSKLRRHIRCHTGERPYQCPHCTYASADTFRLKRHIRTHTGEKPYKCDVCNMCFTQSNSLNVHKLIHNVSMKPAFQCEHCPRKLRRKTDLRIHLQNMHSTGTPIKCKKCGKSFPDRYSHKLHTKTHKGEKCFKCEFCPYASTALRHLNSHMLTHTDEKPFGCDQCDQSFRQKQQLQRHQNLYHNPNYKPKKKTYSCHECKRRYVHKGNLIRHLTTHNCDSGHKEKASALKLGRKQKVKFVDSSADSGNEPKQILNLHLEGSKLQDGQLVMVESSDGEQYVVVEVIQIEDDKQQHGLVPVYADDEQEDNNNNANHLHSKCKGIEQAFKFEKDLETCFGFDEEEMDKNWGK